MTPVWVDTNVLLRFLTNAPEEQARRALDLMRRAAGGEITLVVPVVVIAEIAWVMRSLYGHPASKVADALRLLVLADGVAVENDDVVLDALDLLAGRSVDFADAYLVAAAARRGEAIATFDTDLRKLGAAVFAI